MQLSASRAAAVVLGLASVAALAAFYPLAGSYSFAWQALSESDSNFDWGQPPPWPIFSLVHSLAAWLPRLQARLLPPHLNAILLGTAFAPAKALYALTRLGVADTLAERGPTPAAELASIFNVKPDELRRLLQAVGVHGIFKEVRPGVFANNRGSSVLRRDHPNSLRNMLLCWGDESYWAHEKLYESLSLGSPPSFQLQSGGPSYFEWLGQPGNEGRMAIFHAAMVEASAAMNAVTLMDYPWGRHANQTLSDIGGGLGGFLADLLRSQPSMHGVLVDLPDVVSAAGKHWREEHPSLLGLVKMVPADFFTHPLPQADIHFLRYILHDWPDPEATHILRAVRAAIPPGAESATPLLIQDVVMPAGRQLNPAYVALDLQMLSISGSKERGREEWEALLRSAGFQLVRVHRMRTLTSIIEARALPEPA